MSFKESKNPTVMDPLVKTMLAALSAVPTKALLVPCEIRLFNNDVQISRYTLRTALIEPTWAGYAAAAIAALEGPLNLDQNNDGMAADGIFTCTTAPTSSDTIFGYFITDVGGANLLAAERFDSPVAIALAGDFVSVQFVFPEPFLRPWAG
jgi:hypothetical protein